MSTLKEHLDHRLSIYLLVTILSGLMLFYNLVYVPSNEEKVNEHALRIMGNRARVLKEKYAAYQTAINSAQLSYFVYWYFRINPDADSIYVVRDNLTLTYHFATSKNWLSKINGIEPTRFTRNDFNNLRVDMNLIPLSDLSPDQVSDFNVSRIKNGDYYFIYQTDLKYFEYTSKSAAPKESEIQKDTAFQYFWLRVKGFSANIKSTDFFDDVFLLRDPKDKLKYNSKNLDKITFEGQILDDSRLNLGRFTLPVNTEKIGTGVYDEKISNQDYKVYYNLVKLKNGLSVYVVGVISTKSFQKYARQIPNWFLIFCSLGILILILLFPVLKLFFLNEHERLTAMDGRLSVFSLVMCGSLLVIVLCGSYLFWVPELNNTEIAMEDLSLSMKKNFELEVSQLDSAIRKDSLFSEDQITNSKKFKKKNKGIEFNEVFSLAKNGFMFSIFFSDTTRINDINKLPIRLTNRDYFKTVKAAVDNRVKIDYHMEAINSLTSGKGEIAIAIPLTTKDYVGQSKPGPNEGGGFMRVITSTPRSIINAQLPSPYKFAIVDRAGEIKFSSKGENVIFENFISECNNNKVIAAYFENEIEGSINFNYLRKDCKGYVRPLLNGWSLIVYYELSNSRAFAAQVFSMCLITLVIIAIYILLLQIILSMDNPRPIYLKTKSFFYDWLNPNNSKVEVWLLLTSTNLVLFLLELVWFLLNKSITHSIIFVFLTITVAYYVAYTRLSIFREAYSPIKSHKWLLVIIGVWSGVFFILNFANGYPWHNLMLIAILVILRLNHKMNVGEVVVNSGNKFTSYLSKGFTSYRLFLLSSLFVLAIGPSILFIADHFVFQNFVRNYSYLLEDTRGFQTRSVFDKSTNKGTDYMEKQNPEKTYSYVTQNNLDFGFYSSIPRYSMHDAEFSGNRFNHVPNYSKDSIFTSEGEVMVKAPLSNFEKSAKWEGRVRRLDTRLFLFEIGTILIGLVSIIALGGFFFALRNIAGKIFFMPASDFPYPDKFPDREVSKNIVEREFENDELDKHPLKFLSYEIGELKHFKKIIIDKYNKIIKEEGYHNQNKNEEAILEIQKVAEPEYKKRWDALNDQQRFLLFDLAVDGVTNQADTSMFNELSKRGLLRLKPKLELVNVSFANYVRNNMPKEKEIEWRKNEGKMGRWNNLRIALIIIIVSSFGFLSVAEEDFLGRVSALIASVAVAVPNLISSISQLGKLFVKE